MEESLEELALLVDTAGGIVLEKVTQERKQLHPAYYIGRGKVDEIKELASALDANSIIFDSELSPAQVKNLEKITKKKILDRSGVILDIFAKRAKSREAKTQVELAQLQYFLPRLSGHWTHLSRQYGGIGTKGPGETQLEVDRRMVRKRIAHLKDELKRIKKSRETMRQERNKEFKVVLIGYTNTGKSTILNALSGADVFVEDRLFATLDSTIRQVKLSEKRKIVLIDTVGFIKKLPPQLISSFHSTLEELKIADLLLHVIDINHQELQEHIKTVNKILKDLDVINKPVIYIFNKIDLLEENLKEGTINRLSKDYSPYVILSAINKFNLDVLKNTINIFLEQQFVEKSINIPLHNSRLISYIYSVADILEQTFLDDMVHLRFRLNKSLADKVDNLVCEDEKVLIF